MDEEFLPPGMPFEDGREEMARRIAREEIASLCGLVLRRARENEVFAAVRTGWEEIAQDKPVVLVERLEAIFGEALADFGGSESKPGPEKSVTISAPTAEAGASGGGSEPGE